MRMFKKHWALIFALAACLLLPVTAQAKGFKNLSFMGSYAERHPTVVNYWLPWFKQTEKALNGQLTFNYFSSNTLYPEPESLDAMSDGRGDFGVVRASVFPGAMNLITAVDIPGMAPNSVVGSLVTWELIEKFPQVAEQFPKNTIAFTAWTSAPYQLHTIKPLKSLEELKGKKIIVWDAIILEVAQALGANPIRLTSTDSYLALSKGMADGVICPMAPVRSFKISDAARYHMMLDAGVGTFNMFAYAPLWNDMPEDMKAYLTKEGGQNMALQVGKSLEDGARADSKWMTENGHEIFMLDDATKATVKERLAPFKEKWVAERKAEGIDEKLARDIIAFTEERVVFHEAEMAKGTYGDYSQK